MYGHVHILQNSAMAEIRTYGIPESNSGPKSGVQTSMLARLPDACLQKTLQHHTAIEQHEKLANEYI